MTRASAPPAANLSDTRRNKLGTAILRGILSVFGPAAACFLVRFIALTYALTDKQAEQRALPYLKHRFPGARGFRLRARRPAKAEAVCGWILARFSTSRE